MAAGFFDYDFRLDKLSKLKDPLEKLLKHVDFEIFRNYLESSLTKETKSNAGRKPYDYVMLFKILILQRYYSISDEQVEFQINDRLSFMRFLEISMADEVPDSKTVWKFRETLTQLEMIKPLFDIFLDELRKKNLIVNEGKILDATIAEVPRQRNKVAENEMIKQGNVPEDWKKKPNKLAQKDIDARWLKKRGQTFFGYKNHIKTGQKYKLIENYIVTSANVHDSVPTENLIEEQDKGNEIYADSAYTGPEVDKVIENKQLINRINEKGYRNNLLDEKQKLSNKEKSRIRSRVEHVFGYMENNMCGLYLECIGIKRATAQIGLINLTYNMFRFCFLAK